MKKYIIPTIDVEALRSLSRLGNFDNLILGKIGNNLYGAPKIADILKEFGGKGTFFIDYAEVGHGLNNLKKLSDLLIKNDMDIQLHIHPQFCFDKNKFLMNQYTLEEQNFILEKCIDTYTKSTGDKPLAFRAGGYGADDNTFKLLKRHKILIDSSYFKNHRWCKMSDFPLNRVSCKDGIYEVPITLFKNNIEYKFAGVGIKKIERSKKLDIDGSTLDELKLGFDALFENDISIIILFLHSFTFLKWNYNYNKFTPDKSDIKKFRFILRYALEKGYEISSLKDIKNNISEYVKCQSVLPSINTERNFVKSAFSTLNKNIKKKLRGK